jgi:ankyrin repeat protein
VRTRSSKAVDALIENGANPLLMNKSGSTPLHLAVQNTGRSDSGSDSAKVEQRRIIALLLEHGASPTDADANGKTVTAAASSDWIRDLLDAVDRERRAQAEAAADRRRRGGVGRR